MGLNGSGGLLIMSVSATVPEISRGNEKCNEEEEDEKNDIFLAVLASL